jgi:casein kinase 1
MSMDQMITRIEYIHSKGFVHRDVKPDNFLIGRLNKKEQIYIIDFGLAKRYKDEKTGKHIPYEEGKSLIGTARYASINTHLGVDQSRRDDIEALAYILIYFMKGSLPWQGLKAKNMKEKYDKIKEKKISTSIHELCEGLSNDFVKFITYARELKFDSKPDYIFLKNIIRQVMKDNKLAFSTYKFDWLNKGEKNKYEI